jgi:hypothetical protein
MRFSIRRRYAPALASEHRALLVEDEPYMAEALRASERQRRRPALWLAPEAVRVLPFGGHWHAYGWDVVAGVRTQSIEG